MSFLESAFEGLGELFEKAKDLPTEKIALIGITVITVGAIAKDLAQGNIEDATEKAKGILGS